jgi:hypothetical protein
VTDNRDGQEIMDYTPQQRAIITRIGEISAELDATLVRHRAAQAEAGRSILDAATALTDAINRAAEIGELTQRHGDLWREFLDTL